MFHSSFFIFIKYYNWIYTLLNSKMEFKKKNIYYKLQTKLIFHIKFLNIFIFILFNN